MKLKINDRVVRNETRTLFDGNTMAGAEGTVIGQSQLFPDVVLVEKEDGNRVFISQEKLDKTELGVLPRKIKCDSEQFKGEI